MISIEKNVRDMIVAPADTIVFSMVLWSSSPKDSC
jgi:hypothetical protein